MWTNSEAQTNKQYIYSDVYAYNRIYGEYSVVFQSQENKRKEWEGEGER